MPFAGTPPPLPDSSTVRPSGRAPVRPRSGGLPGSGLQAFSPYFATQASPSRGQLWAFAEDTRRQLSPASRIRMMLDTRTLFASVGAVRAIANLARIIGSVRPQATSGDTRFDAAAEAAFARITGSAMIFDAGGRWTFETVQPFMTLRRFIDGDVFALLTESPSGFGRIAIREGHCVANPPDNDGAWNDGVLTDRNGFPVKYWFRGTTSEKGRALGTSSVHHSGNWVTEGGTRGEPALAASLNDLRDITELKGYLKTSAKIAAAMGLVPKGGQTQSMSGAGVASSLHEESFGPVDASGGELLRAETYSVEQIIGGGMIPDKEYGVISDTRPSPNILEFRREMLRELCTNIGAPPDIMYHFDDRSASASRVDLDIFSKFLADQYRTHLIPFAQRIWTYVIAKEIAAGRLQGPSTGDFWKVRWTFPRSLTADMGRMGKLAVELRTRGMMTLSRFYDELGLDWQEEQDQWAEEWARATATEARLGMPPGTMTAALRPSNVTMVETVDAAAA